MLAHRLLAASGAGRSSPIPPPPTFALQSASNGGLSQLNVPTAIRHGTTTIYSWVDGAGSLECATYEDDGTTGGPYTIHSAFEADAHTNVTMCRRSSDGRWVVVYSYHNSHPIYQRVSSSADDVSAWGSATDIDGQLGGTNYTDASLFEIGGDLWLFYRDEPSPGTDSRWCYSTSTDGGATWSAQTIFYRNASARSYLAPWYDGSLVHFAATNGGNSRIGHFTFGGTTWRTSDGTDMGAVPFAYADISEVYIGSTAPFMWNVTTDTAGYPVIAARDALEYLYLRWDGAAWATTNLGSCGSGYDYDGLGGGHIAYGACVDDGDANTMWLIKDVSSQPELFRYRTSDGGSTFSSIQVTTGSSDLLIQAICVRNPGPLRAYMGHGSWTSYTSYSLGLTGVGT